MTDGECSKHPVVEAVIIAGLSALVAGLANALVERLTKKKKRKAPKGKP